jgi:hypothetical protein
VFGIRYAMTSDPSAHFLSIEIEKIPSGNSRETDTTLSEAEREWKLFSKRNHTSISLPR